MLSRRLAEDAPEVGVTSSSAEEFWATMFLVVVIILALCMICACCGLFAQMMGCGSFLTQYLLSCFTAISRFCTSCCNSSTPKASVVSPDPPSEAKVIGPAKLGTSEELAPLRPKNRDAAESPPKDYTCCGFELPCLAWFSVCGCSFVGCAWLTTCWKRGSGEGGDRRNRRESPNGGLSFIQNLFTCWRCFGLLPSCCPAQYELPRPRRNAAVGAPKAPPPPPPPPVETPKPPAVPVVQGEPVYFVDTAPRPMPALNLAQ